MVDHITQFFAFYILFFFFGALALSACGLPFLEAISTSATAIGNVGPGLGAVGPASNFALLPTAGKIIMTLLMLFGRLEIFTVLVLFLPGFWKK